MLRTNTEFPKESEFDVKWYLIDADNQILGRLATKVATVLRGKHDPRFTPHADLGFRVVVTNARKVRVTGKKREQKKYFHHTGYPGGGKEISFEELMKKDPTAIISKAVKGMLPKNRLGRKSIGKLKVYADSEHPHQAQNPEILELNS